MTDTLPLFTPPLVHADATDRQAACSVLLPLLKSCCGTPAALVVAIEHDVCRVVCSTGWLGPREMPRVLSFSGRAAMHGGLFEISDLAASRISAQKISAHPHVDARIIGTTTEPSLAASVRFYAAQPICSNTGQVLGALCVADSRPHKLDATQKEALHALAGIATQLLEASLHEARARSQAVRALHLERDLAQARAQLMQAQSLARIGSWTYDLNSTKLTVSAVACEIMGIVPAVHELEVQDYISVVHPSDRLYVWRECFNSLAAGAPLVLEYRMRLRDGQVRYVEGRSQPVFDEAGTLSGFSGLLVDLTERKQAEREWRLHQQAMAASHNAVMLIDATDAAHPLIHVNPAFEKLTGFSRAEVIGRNSRFLQGHDLAQAGLEEIQAALHEARYGEAVLRNYRKDGSAFWAELRISPILDETGRLTHFAGYLTDVSRRILDQENLAHQAMHDPLTGLPNRNLLQDRLQQTIALAQADHSIGVAFIDLDRFKRVNDSLGHEVGDELLQTVAQRLREAARTGDTIARFGGDEFVLIAPGLDRAAMAQQVSQLERVLNAPIAIHGKVIEIRASIGVTLYPADGTSAADLLKHADAAMYLAKAAGRAQAQFFDASIGSTALIKFELEAELIRAVHEQEFVLHFQPEIDAHTGLLRGFEALVRWQHPVRGLIMPNDFIALAEESGLIESIGAWVLRAACLANRQWLDSGFARVPVAVNVSRSQFRNLRFAEMVDEVLQETGLPADLLCLEITESTVMEDAERLFSTLQTLRNLGVRIAIDDFGTGYSSLSVIKQLPIDILKIDRAFVRDLTIDAADASICRTIIAMAQGLQLAVVAEGVETEAQMRFLQDSGCDILQGYLICRPQPAAEVEAFLRSAWDPARVSLAGTTD